jgi:hypothetical protein
MNSVRTRGTREENLGLGLRASLATGERRQRMMQNDGKGRAGQVSSDDTVKQREWRATPSHRIFFLRSIFYGCLLNPNKGDLTRSIRIRIGDPLAN